MVHYFRPTRTALILILLFFIALENTIALSQRVNAESAAYKLNDVMLDEESSGMRINKDRKRSARKMAMEQVNTGDARSSSSEPWLQPSETEDSGEGLKDERGNEGVGVTITMDGVQGVDEHYSLSRHGIGGLMSSSQVLKPSEKQKLIEASDEVFKLLNRDYNLRPRRHPPVHN